MKLLNGDCLDIMPTLPDRCVDLVLCDLPYGSTTCPWDIVIPFNDQIAGWSLDNEGEIIPVMRPGLWSEYKRLLRPGGVVVLFGSQPFTSLMITSNFAWFKYELIGDKNKCGSPGLAKIRPMKTHENICVFAPGRHTYNPQMEQGEPYARKTTKPGGYVGKVNRHGYGLKGVSEFTNTGTRYPKSIMVNMRRDFSAQQQRHATQKPGHTLEYLIKTYSNPGAVVLDNCFGSGQTGIACQKTGREFIGIEKDPEIFANGAAWILSGNYQ